MLGAYHKLSRGNAENWWAKKDGYSRGQTPKLGAVACWRKGQVNNSNDGCGHVAVVEAIAADGTITCSESNYGGSRFGTRKVKPPYNIGSSLKFQGFIYIPLEFEEKAKEEPKKEEVKVEEPKVEVKTEPKVEQPKFKVGDKVKITKAGRSTKTGGRTAYGIGWTRYVTAIHTGAAYPYQIGNKGSTRSKDTTGFYKEDAIKKA